MKQKKYQDVKHGIGTFSSIENKLKLKTTTKNNRNHLHGIAYLVQKKGSFVFFCELYIYSTYFQLNFDVQNNCVISKVNVSVSEN